MNKCIFLAGAGGVIGRHLVPLLLADGWRIVGTTRSEEKTTALRQMGVEPVIVDVFDADAVRQAVVRAQPEVVIHQLTDLPAGLDPSLLEQSIPRNARLRDVGTRHLVTAALEAGVGRLIAQSIAFAYAEGPLPHVEDDKLSVDAEGNTGINARGVASLETQVLEANLHGIVLRYGRLYGPGTGFAVASGPSPLHVDDAADATRLAITHGDPGIYNIAEDDGTVSIEKAKRLLGWNAKKVAAR
jgi:nucleoside-diphosphate-sugar epimerase